MMRFVLAACAAAAVLAVPSAAFADGEYLKVTPSTIQAGFQVELEAFCGDNVNPATVSSDAFGVVTITPMQDPKSGKFIDRGKATVPTNTKPGAYKVRLTCPSQQSATTTLHVVGFNVPSRGPHTGGGAMAASAHKSSNMMIGGGIAVALAGGALLFLGKRRRKAAE